MPCCIEEKSDICVSGRSITRILEATSDVHISGVLWHERSQGQRDGTRVGGGLGDKALVALQLSGQIISCTHSSCG